MDEELDQLEAELKTLRPLAPSRSVVARITRELNESAGLSLASRHDEAGQTRIRNTGSLLQWFLAFALPAAAAIALMSLQSSRDQSRLPPALNQARAATAISAEKSLKPVTAEKLLVSAQEDGLVTLEDGTPARRERLEFVDTITWSNPRTHASMRWSVPREEVRVVPVSFQ